MGIFRGGIHHGEFDWWNFPVGSFPDTIVNVIDCYTALVQLNCYLYFIAKLDLFVINSFLANIPFLYPLKTSENQRFSILVRG